MEKRGSSDVELMLNTLIKIVVVAFFIFVPVSAFFSTVTTSDFFHRNYLALDISVLTDTVLASPNDLIYNYLQDTKKLNLNVMNGSILVYKGKYYIMEGGYAESYYVNDPSTSIYYKEIKPTFEVLDENEITVPVKLSVVKSMDAVRFYNAREDITE